MFVLLFRYVFGGAIHLPGISYVDFLIPGIIVQTVVFGATSTAVGLSQASCPSSRWYSPARSSSRSRACPAGCRPSPKNQPISRAANTVRALTQGGAVATNLIWTLLWSTAILAVFAPLAVRRYRKV